ncbi:MAG: cell wall hydrolase [Thermoanaerobacteraceae bacterium]|nr:cell wall hydrolase [Thermoanaerobacteraceae bacterium]
MSYNFRNKWRFGSYGFGRRMIKNVAGVAITLVGVAVFIYLGFISSAAIQGHNKAHAMNLNKETFTTDLKEDKEEEEGSSYYLASIMLYSLVIEDSSTTAIEEMANDKKEQRLKEEEERKKKLEEEKKRKKQEQKQNEATKTASRGSGYSVTNKELDLLERVVMAEAGAEPYEGKIAVVNVIMNRVAHKSYPNTIEGVIFQKGQFTPARNGKIWRVTPTESVKKAVREALNGKKIVNGDVLYFLNPRIATDHSIPRTKTFVKRIGRHDFYK